jgi:hypothetical protein
MRVLCKEVALNGPNYRFCPIMVNSNLLASRTYKLC